MTDHESSAPTATDLESKTEFQPRLTNPHPLIKGVKFTKDGIIQQTGRSMRSSDNALDIRVSRARFRTAIAVMDRLFKALEARGLRVNVSDSRYDRETGTWVCDDWNREAISLREENRRVPHEPTKRELAEQEKWQWSSIPKWDHIPTGQLIFEPGGPVDLTSAESLECVIKNAVDAIQSTLARKREAQLRQAEESRKQIAREQAKRAEKERFDSLLSSADSYHRYRCVLDYIEEVRRFGLIPSGQYRAGQSMDEWVAWATKQARKVHPLGG